MDIEQEVKKSSFKKYVVSVYSVEPVYIHTYMYMHVHVRMSFCHVAVQERVKLCDMVGF